MHLKESGPIYAVYKTTDPTHTGEHGYHMVVVTGVNLTKGTVSTNNPWKFSGEQSYDSFLNGFLGMEDDKKYQLLWYIPIENGV